MAALEKKAQHAPFPRAAKPCNPSPRHKRSKSDLEEKDAKGALRSSQKSSCGQTKMQGRNSTPQQICEAKKGIQPRSETQKSLKKEILQLEMHLKDQQVVRGALEKALGPDPAPVTLQNESPMLKPATQLIREVATLELEIKHLEQYLLTLYRKAFEQQQQQKAPTTLAEVPKLSSVSSRSTQLDETPPKTKAPVSRGGDPALHYSCPPLSKGSRRNNGAAVVDDCSPSTCPRRTTTDLLDPAGLRSQSALSFRGVWSSRISPTEDSLARALRSCHSQPFSFLEEGETTATSGVVSLADYLGTNVADHIPETPNNLSEEMVRCMAGVYCKLADPPLVHHRPSSSPSSSLSSAASVAAVSSPQYLGEDMWSPTNTRCGRRREEDAAALDSRLINPFRVEGLKEFSGPYSAMVEVPAVSRDRRRLREAEDLLQTYRLILYRLETVDLRRMTSEEKLAFWINIHNALVMHAYLKYGVPQNQLKKTSLLVKAECKIAGRTINAAVIQGLVLGCSTHCSTPGHWLRALLHPRMKSRGMMMMSSSSSKTGGSEWQAFAVRQPEPLLRFALCSGSHSDPADLQHQQRYERETILSQIDHSRRSLLTKLKEYKGQDCEVIHEAAAFAGEKIEHDDGLILPPYSNHVTNSYVLDDLYPLTYVTKSKHLRDGSCSGGTMTQEGARRNGLEKGITGPQRRGVWGGIGSFIGWVAKTAVMVVGAVSIMKAAGYEPVVGGNIVRLDIGGLFGKQAAAGSGEEQQASARRCPPGKAMVLEGGRAHCVVRERVEVPFDTDLAAPNAIYGLG